jgi:hypothetical protein
MIEEQIKAAEEANIELHSLEPTDSNIDNHPYRTLFQSQFDKASTDYGLQPTIYFFEAMAYHERATVLQQINLGQTTEFEKSTDDLQDNVKIYDTVTRWCAGFSNAPQEMWYGKDNPKHSWNVLHNLPSTEEGYRHKFNARTWFYLLYIHRVAGSGASFSLPGDRFPAHGWYNTPLPMLCEKATNFPDVQRLLTEHKGPLFSSIGNQIPSFNKLINKDMFRNGGHEYLVQGAPDLTDLVYNWLVRQLAPVTIQQAVDKALEIQSSLGYKKYKFVITAWIMDIAEYFPQFVFPDSNCYHGKNAIEAMELVFKPIGKKNKQNFYDTATRFFADVFRTRPMDVEDCAPGCDAIRYFEQYIKPGAYLHVDRTKVFNKCFIKHPFGRQPWKIGTSEWIW